jgi:putative ABC transport system permease protein
MSYALTTLWHDRQRYLPGVVAVAFSAVLIALQGGLLLGLFSITSLPVDHATADIWVGNADVLSVDLGRPIPQAWMARLARDPDVERSEIYLQGFTHWTKPGGGVELCCLIGSRLDDDSLGAVRELSGELRTRLTEPGSVVVDEAELERLGVEGVGSIAEIHGHRVRVVGLVHGLKSIAGPYIFCSVVTARPLLRMQEDQATYLLARCRPGADHAAVVERLGAFPNMSAFTADALSLRSRLHWLTKTKAGIALGCAAVLGLLVGAAVTSQTLRAAIAAAVRELAMLRALGIPRWRMGTLVLGQSFWVGVAGVLGALPAVALLGYLGGAMGAKVLLPAWLLGLAGTVTMLVALASGLSALRSLRAADPAVLLR